MKFEWDEAKAEANAKKHGVTFPVAMTAFDDPFALLAADTKHSTAEETREWLIGEADTGVLVVVFTRRLKGQVFRLISARSANRREGRLYEQSKRISI